MITVFTPTYNRVKELGVLFDSLCSQTIFDFVWSVVDDGSTDDTMQFVENISQKAPFIVEYHYQPNSGKHVAINYILDHCSTEYVICVDSDDYLSNNAIENLHSMIKENEGKSFWAIVGPRFSPISQASTWNSDIPKELPFTKIYTEYGYSGETFMLWRLKSFEGVRFPVFSTEKFIPEGAIYEILDQHYNVITSKDKVYYSQYMENGLTKNSRLSFSKNRKGYAYANYIASQNKNRSVLNRSLYYGRFVAIKNRIIDNEELSIIDTRAVTSDVRILGSINSIAFSLLYALRNT